MVLFLALGSQNEEDELQHHVNDEYREFGDLVQVLIFRVSTFVKLKVFFQDSNNVLQFSIISFML